MNMKDYLVGTERTRAANYAVTDSAAGGTALSSGYRTNNKYVGVDPNGVPHATILEAAQIAGKRVGMCTTYEWSNATPASFSSHHMSRADYSWIDTAVKLYQNDETSISSEVLINNYSDVEGLEYQLCLIFYDEDNRLIGASPSQKNTIDNSVIKDTHSVIIPDGTATVKAVAWSDFTKMIPLCEYDLASKQ